MRSLIVSDLKKESEGNGFEFASFDCLKYPRSAMCAKSCSFIAMILDEYSSLFCRPSPSRLWLPSVCVFGAVTEVVITHQPSYCRTWGLWHVGNRFKVTLFTMFGFSLQQTLRGGESQGVGGREG